MAQRKIQAKARYGYGDTIDYADDLARDRLGRNATYRDMIVRQLIALNKPELIPLATGKPVGKPVKAMANHSRWVAVCEYCDGAQAVNINGSFFCTTCLNLKNGNKPRPIIFPKEAEKIEMELLKRKKPKNRNWFPYESLAKIKKENSKHITKGRQ